MTSPRAQAIAILAGTPPGERTQPAIGPAGSDARDDALVRELVAGANLHYRLYDHLAARFLQPRPQPPLLTMALRVGCHQLFALDRVPPHAAVSETVAGLRDAGGPKLVSVANAVLRRLSELRLDARDGDSGPVGRLRLEVRPGDSGLAHSLPALLVRELAPLLDADPARRLSDLNRRAPLCTRTRPRRPDPIGHSILRRDGPWTWWEDPAEALAWVADGVCMVQDRSQGEVADLAASVGLAGPGTLVLDLCAAPGGKSLALADIGCRVVAADASRERLRDLDTLVHDLPLRLAQDGLHPALAQAFDVVLVDAPCSNSGVFARRPEAKQRYDERHLASLATIQRGLLTSAAGLARPDGRLIYATCSLSPAENQGIAHTLPGWRLLGERLRWPDAWSGGGYAAVLVRA